MVSVTVSSAGGGAGFEPWVIASPRWERACLLLDMGHVLISILLDGRDHRRRGEIAQGAQHLAGNFARERQQQVEVAWHAAALFDPRQDLPQPRGAFAARRALATRLMTEE